MGHSPHQPTQEPTQAQIEKACLEIVEYHLSALEALGLMARPFLCVEERFAQVLNATLREKLPLNSEEEFSNMTEALLIIAKTASAAHVRQ